MAKSQQSLFGEDTAPWEQDAKDDISLARVFFVTTPHGPYDYRVPDALRGALQPGMRVKVPLGNRTRSREGYCCEILDRDQLINIQRKQWKDVHEIVDERPLLTTDLLELARWIAVEYHSPIGQVIEAMVPAAVRDQAGTRQQLLLSVPNHVLAKLTQLQLPKKQAHVLKCLAGASSALTLTELMRLAECTSAPINALRKKGLVVDHTERVSSFAGVQRDVQPVDAWQMNADQQAALDAIQRAVRSLEHETLLLHGITGSGKTEVYIKAIDEVIGFGRQAIVLVPEISLTPQTRRRFEERFSKVAVLHSHLTPAERHHQWRRIRDGEIQVVVGARSAVFAPTPNLGLIVLDEEHDASFKQDKIPRYHAREVALHRAAQLRIPVVLGSATPSLESWRRARQNEFRLLELPKRVLNLPLPDVNVVDLCVEFRQSSEKGMISRPLQAAMRQSLADGGQVILLLNRRGFARHIQCPSCGNVVVCPNCDIAMTHHRDDRLVICHYCDLRQPAPANCPDCRFEGIRFSGYGTQKLEDEVTGRFPGVRCLRMDSDSMQRAGSHETALERFRDREIDVLVGTQMIAKGLDFPNVTLVGVVNADTSLHFPDFRAAERTFGLVTQVAGRSGRGEKGGRVIVQTFSPEHRAITSAARHDYHLFAEEELADREAFGYPPFGRLARFVFRGESEMATAAFAESVGDLLTSMVDERSLPLRVLGPGAATIAKIKHRYRFHLLLFAPLDFELGAWLANVTNRFPKPLEVEWIVDIDPLDML